MRKLSTILAITLGLAFFAAPSSAQQYNHHNRQLTPNDDLILAVKGIKNGVAILTGMLNPILGALVAAYNPDESRRDLFNIDEALRKGANLNHREEHSGYTALIYAAYKGYPGIARHLLQKGANVHVKEDKGYNAYTMAQYYLEQYTRSYDRNEREEANYETRERMRSYYQDYINRYSELVSMLAPITKDKQMPKTWW